MLKRHTSSHNVMNISVSLTYKDKQANKHLCYSFDDKLNVCREKDLPLVYYSQILRIETPITREEQHVDPHQC